MFEALVVPFALACSVWSIFVVCVQALGVYKVFQNYSAPPPKPVSPTLDKNLIPHITVIRPVKDLEPGLYECLASTFRQSYPIEKLTVCLCIESVDDAAYPLVCRIAAEFSEFDVRVLVEENDTILHGSDGQVNRLGPNPKIRNMSRAYREAKGDVIWIADCNVWLAAGVAGRMVDKLYGFRADGLRTRPYKFVHSLPLVVNTERPRKAEASETQRPLKHEVPSKSCQTASSLTKITFNLGARLDEMFMATTHAKFYSAINTIAVAPCIVGKSNMFRKSHLDAVTDPLQNPILRPSDACRGRGIDFFSSNICEDHLIGDLLWRSPLPNKYLNHGLVFGDLAIQPVFNMSVPLYIARRVRWLRVRKWTVLLATLVEPGVESLFCCFYLSFGLTTLPFWREVVGLPIPPTWSTMVLTWLISVTIWMLGDWCTSRKLLACQCVELDEHTPAFARGAGRPGSWVGARPFREWVVAWLGRELLALPIWLWAVLLGTTVRWRGRRFKVRMDMTVVEIGWEVEMRKKGVNKATIGARRLSGSTTRVY